MTPDNETLKKYYQEIVDGCIPGMGMTIEWVRKDPNNIEICHTTIDHDLKGVRKNVLSLGISGLINRKFETRQKLITEKLLLAIERHERLFKTKAPIDKADYLIETVMAAHLQKYYPDNALNLIRTAVINRFHEHEGIPPDKPGYRAEIRDGVVVANIRLAEGIFWNAGRIAIFNSELPMSAIASLQNDSKGKKLNSIIEHPYFTDDMIIANISIKSSIIIEISERFETYKERLARQFPKEQ